MLSAPTGREPFRGVPVPSKAVTPKANTGAEHHDGEICYAADSDPHLIFRFLAVIFRLSFSNRAEDQEHFLHDATRILSPPPAPKDRGVVWNWMQNSGTRTLHFAHNVKNVRICIAAAFRRVFLLSTRYLFAWFGFNASEFTCANLEIKGDPLHD